MKLRLSRVTVGLAPSRSAAAHGIEQRPSGVRRARPWDLGATAPESRRQGLVPSARLGMLEQLLQSRGDSCSCSAGVRLDDQRPLAIAQLPGQPSDTSPSAPVTGRLEYNTRRNKAGPQVGGHGDIGDRVRHTQDPCESAGITKRLDKSPVALSRIIAMGPRYDLLDFGTDLGAQLQRRVPQQLVPTLTDLDHGAISPVEGPLPCAVAHGRPVGTHVGERQRARVRMLEIPDQLVEDPCLLRILHTAMRMLLHRPGQDHRPRHVVNLHLGVRPQTQPLGRMNTRRRRNLIGYCYYTIIVIQSSDLDICVDLFGFEFGVARLHLDESLEPAHAPERHPHESVRSHRAPVRRVEGDFGEGLDRRPVNPGGPQRCEQRLRISNPAAPSPETATSTNPQESNSSAREAGGLAEQWPSAR